MAAVRTVAIVGAGSAGLATAIFLAEGGVEVDVFEKGEAWTGIGSGITIQGNALRVLRDLGVWQTVQESSFSFNGIAIRLPDPNATIVAEVPDIKTGGEDLPSTAGMFRPRLTQILTERALEVGVRIHYGEAFVSVADSEDSATLTTSSGSAGEFDLVLGADGLNSNVRPALGIDTTPVPTGMAIWRALVDRPVDIVRTEVIYGGPNYIAAYCPISESSMYVYVVENDSNRPTEVTADAMLELTASYGGPWGGIRDNIRKHAEVNYTRFTSHLVPESWGRGRVILVGDAAHSCPPTMAQGLAMGLEDAAVVSEILLAASTFDESLLAEYSARRIKRVTPVVTGSVQIGQWLLDGVRDADVGSLMASVGIGLTARP